MVNVTKVSPGNAVKTLQKHKDPYWFGVLNANFQHQTLEIPATQSQLMHEQIV